MRVKAIVKYRGTNYHGWQKQIGDNSVQVEIETVLSKVLDEPISIYASGRTDAGVHALGQAFHFDTTKDNQDLERLKYSINLMLSKDIQILSFEKVADDFHSRYQAKVKTYEYKIILSSKEPFAYDLAFVCPYQINFGLLKEAMNRFTGKHDFKNLTSKEIDDEQGFVREIFDIHCEQVKNEITIRFTGNGFMRYMIRYMVGVALAIAMGREELSYIDEILDVDERKIVSYKAPAEGLYLVSVEY